MTSLTVTVTVPAQLSVAVTEAIEAVGTSAAQLTVIAVGVPVIVGAVISCVFIIWVAVVALPQASVTVQVLVITLLLVQIFKGVKQTLLNSILPLTLACFLENMNQVPFIGPVKFSKLET